MRFDTCIPLLSLLALSPISVVSAPAAPSTEVTEGDFASTASTAGTGACSRRQNWGGGRGGRYGRPSQSTGSTEVAASSAAADSGEGEGEASTTTEVEVATTTTDAETQPSSATSESAPEATVSDVQQLGTGGLNPAGGQGGQGQTQAGGAGGSGQPPAAEQTQASAEGPAASSAGSNDSGSGSGTDTSGLTDEEAKMLQLHNDYRADFDAGPLTWDAGLATEARNFYTEHKCLWEHSGMGHADDWDSWRTKPVPMLRRHLSPRSVENMAKAFESWGPAEEPLWNHGDGFKNTTGHFTQVVWKNTQRIGCAHVVCGEVKHVACEYEPGGNVGGKDADGNSFYDFNVGK